MNYHIFYTDIYKNLHSVQRTYHAARFAVQKMGINHGGAHIAVTEKFLYGADVVA